MKQKLILAANAIPHAGGQGLNLHQMVEGLSGLFDLSVFCQSGQTGVDTQHVPRSRWTETIGRIPMLRRRRDWIVLLNETNFDRQVSRRLRPADFFQGVTGQCLKSLKAARALGCQTILDVVTLHNEHYSDQLVNESALFGMPSLQHSRLSRRILEEYDTADWIRVMSEPARQTFLERGFSPKRVFVAPPVIDLARFQRASFKGTRFTISFVGLLEPAKGFHYLIDAFRKLNRPDSELLLWGNTGARPLAQYVREQIAACPAIRLLPQTVSQLGYDKVYGISSVLVHPSLADGFGFVVAEAMASGIPVITTPTTGASEWITDGVNGYVVPPRDVAAIRERLEYLMDHPSRLREMGAAARQTMTQLTLERFRQSYTAALAGRPLEMAGGTGTCPR